MKAKDLIALLYTVDPEVEVMITSPRYKVMKGVLRRIEISGEPGMQKKSKLLREVRSSMVDTLQRYTIDESCTLLRMGRARLYEKIRSGEIRTITDGKRRYIPGTEIARLCGFDQAS
jgi:excisionase family DNA binding protein